MRKPFLLSLLVALLTTLSTHAYDFQSGDLYYNITSDSTVEVTYQVFDYKTNYAGLTNVNIPTSVTNNHTTYSVTSIGNSAFIGCSTLNSITIPHSITKIGDWAFESCGFPSISLPNSITTIGKFAFYYCSNLSSVSIPNSVDSIYRDAFSFCSALVSVTISNSVTHIGDRAFSGCSNLTSMIVDKANTVYDSRDNCNAIIEKATNTLIAGCLSTTIPNSVTNIGNYAFDSCLGLAYILIPNSITYIGQFAFYGCTALTSITIPNSVSTISGWAFYGCTNLTTLTIGTSVSVIGKSAFEKCSSLTSITLPSSVTSIGSYAFYGCIKVTSITCWAITPPTCLDYFYNNYPSKTPLYVPAKSIDAYKAKTVWSQFDVQALITDATLSSLTYDGMLVPFFEASMLHYTIELPSEKVTVPVVEAIVNDPNAQMTVTQATTLPGEASVEVLATDNITRQTYTIYFCKQSTPTGLPESQPNKCVQKLLRNGQVLILRNGVAYDMMGNML